MSRSNNEIFSKQLNDAILDRLVESGFSSVEECLDLCDLQKVISIDYLQEALDDNPFVGRNPNFQDRIERAVLGNNIRKGEK